ncbi:MAG TPA: AraC family transcriptional regulator [Firmicutes bacterium]|nr:AraC family transcriptional regulator [Bacillota bacterium]
MNTIEEVLFFDKSNLIKMHDAWYLEKYNDCFLHWHNEIEIIFVLENQVKYMINNTSRILHAGDMVITNSGDIHTAVRDNCTGHAYILLVSIEAIEKFVNSDVLCSTLIERSKIPEGFYPYQLLQSLFQYMFVEYTSDYDGREKSISALLQLLMLNIRRCSDYGETLNIPNKRIKEATVCRQIISFFNEHEPQQYTLSGLAEYLGYSPNHLCKVFKKIFSLSFNEYVTQLKVLSAQNMLRQTSLSVSQISSQCGFSSDRVFNISFKKVCGMSPSEYRKSTTDL